MLTSTAILGRKEVYVQIDIALSKARQIKQRMIVVLINMDRFYEVNETKGFSFGHKVLKAMADRIKDATPKDALMARIESGTFVIVMPDANISDCNSLAIERLKSIVERPLDDNGTEIYLTASIGAAFFPQDGQIAEQLVSRAETAMYHSKSKGGNRIAFYQEEDNQRLTRKLAIETGLRPALYMQQFHVHYQPFYTLSDGKLKGFAAQIRWTHPVLGAVSPSEFIPLAEKNGLVNPIGEWVIREACKMIRGLNKYGAGDLLISVHVSKLQLLDKSFYKTVMHLLEEYQMNPVHLCFSVMDCAEGELPDGAVETLRWLRAAGASVSLDNFGHGVSALSNLYRIPITGLVLDKDILKAIVKEGPERTITEAIIGLAHKLGIEVTAAGIESEEQYLLLKEWGCDYVQGFLLDQRKEPEIVDMSIIHK